MLARLALVTVLTTAASAHAAPSQVLAIDDGAPFALAGKGMRKNFTLGGNISRGKGGVVKGDFVIILTTGDDTSTSCRYQKLDKVTKVGGKVTFDGHGVCITVAPSGVVTQWKAVNTFSIVQGEGKAADVIDVNMQGSTGITIPGGKLESGDFVLRG